MERWDNISVEWKKGKKRWTQMIKGRRKQWHKVERKEGRKVRETERKEGQR